MPKKLVGQVMCICLGALIATLIGWGDRSDADLERRRSDDQARFDRQILDLRSRLSVNGPPPPFGATMVGCPSVSNAEYRRFVADAALLEECRFSLARHGQPTSGLSPDYDADVAAGLSCTPISGHQYRRFVRESALLEVCRRRLAELERTPDRAFRDSRHSAGLRRCPVDEGEDVEVVTTPF